MQEKPDHKANVSQQKQRDGTGFTIGNGTQRLGRERRGRSSRKDLQPNGNAQKERDSPLTRESEQEGKKNRTPDTLQITEIQGVRLKDTCK